MTSERIQRLKVKKPAPPTPDAPQAAVCEIAAVPADIQARMVDEPCPAKKKKKQKQQPPKTQVLHTCGHVTGIAHFESQKCPACKQKPRKMAEDDFRFPAGVYAECSWDGREWHLNLEWSQDYDYISVVASGIEKAWRMAKEEYLKITGEPCATAADVSKNAMSESTDFRSPIVE